MKSLRLSLSLTAVLAMGLLFTVARAEQPAAANAELIARGSYLVNRTGLCIDCHSPRDEKGQFLPGLHLTGAPIGFTPMAPMPWAGAAPRLAGLPAGFTAEQFVTFLMTGERPDGRGQPLPPMPGYRYEKAEAEAIAAYLRSLPVTGGE